MSAAHLSQSSSEIALLPVNFLTLINTAKAQCMCQSSDLAGQRFSGLHRLPWQETDCVHIKNSLYPSRDR